MFRPQSNTVDYKLFELLVERMHTIIAQAKESYQFISAYDDNRRVIKEHAILQQQLKKLLDKLEANMQEMENKLANRTAYLTRNIPRAWEDYETEANAEMVELKTLTGGLTGQAQLLRNQQQLFNDILDDISTCFKSNNELLDDELKKAVKQKLLQVSLQKLGQADNNKPSCFISYSWGNPANTKRVHQLAWDLKQAGIDVKLDIWDNTTNSVAVFLSLITTVNYVIVVGTPDMVEKWKNYNTSGKSREQVQEEYKGNVVAQELEQISTRKTSKPANNHGILCLLLQGNHPQSFPDFLAGLASDSLNFTNRDNTYMPLFNLLKELNKGNDEKKRQIDSALEDLNEKYKLVDACAKDKLLEMYQACQKKESNLSEQEIFGDLRGRSESRNTLTPSIGESSIHPK